MSNRSIKDSKDMERQALSSFAEKRRSLLKTFVSSGISYSVLAASPLVGGILYSRNAEAQSTGLPNKSVAIYVPGGGIHDFWAPSGSGSNMQMGAMSSGYEPVKTQCNFLLNMSHANAGHGQQPLILNDRWGGRDSYDVEIGKQLGPLLPFTYLNLGVHSNGNGYITRDGSDHIPFQDNPFNVFNLLFGSNTGGSGNAKSAIIDAHAEAANAIKNKLAGYEVERMDAHLDAISDTQRRLDSLAGGGMSCPAAPNSTEFPLTHETFSQQARLQADMAVAALKCNLTSSVSLAFGNHQSQFRIPELNFQGLYHQSIHGGSNGLPNYPYYTEMRNHLGSLTAYLIGKLESEGIIDSTVVIETTDMGHADLHAASDVPMMIAGGGSRINKAVTTSTGGAYDQHDLLQTAGQACGIDLDFGNEIPGILA